MQKALLSIESRDCIATRVKTEAVGQPGSMAP